MQLANTFGELGDLGGKSLHNIGGLGAKSVFS
jgi:hypothetical protein